MGGFERRELAEEAVVLRVRDLRRVESLPPRLFARGKL
jgi:hypothetical protein